MNRRDLMRGALAAGVSPLAASAQQDGRVRIVGMLYSLPPTDQLVQSGRGQLTRVAEFTRGLEKLGWVDGRNIRIERRSSYGGPAARAQAIRELIALKPDVVMTSSTPETIDLAAATKTIPIVFATAADPVGSGLVESLARPGGNVTGFTNSTAAMGAKWVQFLKEIDPRVDHIGVLFNPNSVPRGGRYYLERIEPAAASLGVDTTPLHVTDPSALEDTIRSFAARPARGLILPPDSFTVAYRQRVVSAAGRYRIPAMYTFRYFITEGGLISFGADLEVRGVDYVDLILRGAKPGELPVQSPRKYELLINRKTADTLGLTLSMALLAGANQIIE